MNDQTPYLNPYAKPKNETLALIHGIYAGILSFALAAVLYLEYQKHEMQQSNLMIFSALAVLMIGLNIWACIQVKKGGNAGLLLSRVMAAFMLLSFPIGTVLGGIALWKSLKSQWEV